MKSFRNVCLLGSVLFLTSMMNATAAQGQSSMSSFTGKDGMIAVCHSTGSKENPYELIEVSDNGAAHQKHPADIMPAPVEGCPEGGGEPTEPQPVPEPLTMLLFGAGVAGAGYAARRFKKKG